MNILTLILSFLILVYLSYFIVENITSTQRMTKWQLIWHLTCLCAVTIIFAEKLCTFLNI